MLLLAECSDDRMSSGHRIRQTSPVIGEVIGQLLLRLCHRIAPFRICHTFLTDRLVFTLRYGFTLSGSLFTGTTLTFRTFTGGFRLGLGTGDLLGDLLLYLSV